MTTKPRRIISPREADDRANTSPSTRRRWEEQGIFPQAVIIGPNRKGYYEDEIDEFVNSRPRGKLDAPKEANQARKKSA